MIPTDRGSEKSYTSQSSRGGATLGVSSEIQKKLKYVFHYFDTDGNGTIDRDELNALLTVLEKGSAQKELDAIMIDLNVKKDDELHFTDFIRLLNQYYKRHSNISPDASDCFNIFDRTNNCTVSREDVARVMQALGEEVCAAEIKAMMAEARVRDDEEGISETRFYQLLFRLGLISSKDGRAKIIHD